MVGDNDIAVLHFKTNSKQNRRKDRTMKNKIKELERKLYDILDDLNDFGVIYDDDLYGKAYEAYDNILCCADDVICYLNLMRYELEKEGVIEE